MSEIFNGTRRNLLAVGALAAGGWRAFASGSSTAPTVANSVPLEEWRASMASIPTPSR